MYIEWDERRAKRTQYLKFAAALLVTAAIAAIPIVAVGFDIGL
jgi:hypothetical protein